MGKKRKQRTWIWRVLAVIFGSAAAIAICLVCTPGVQHDAKPYKLWLWAVIVLG